MGERERMPLLLYGAGGHGRVVLDAARATEWFEVRGFLDDDPGRWGDLVHGAAVLGGLDVLRGSDAQPCVVVVSIGDGEARQRVARHVQALGLSCATIIHPQAVVGSGAVLGEGTILLPLAVVHTDASVGRHVIVNTAAVVEHDAVIGDFAHLSPGVTLGGGVQVGAESHLGLGACVVPGVCIGRGVTVAAGAVVVDDVADGTAVAGVPARPMRGALDGAG